MNGLYIASIGLLHATKLGQEPIRLEINEACPQGVGGF